MAHDDDAIYQEVEKIVAPIIESNARRFCIQLGMNVDEAKQEAREALVSALRRYDYNKSRGGIFNYAKKAVRLHFLKKWAEHRAQARRPHVRVKEGGKFVTRPIPFALHVVRSDVGYHAYEGDFMDIFTGSVPLPDSGLVEADTQRMLDAFQAALEDGLTERDRDVLRCKCDPPRGLRMLMIEELAQEPTIPLIGRYLNLSKNEVDWALRRIRERARELLSRDEFSDLGALSIVRSHGG